MNSDQRVGHLFVAENGGIYVLVDLRDVVADRGKDAQDSFPLLDQHVTMTVAMTVRGDGFDAAAAPSHCGRIAMFPIVV